MCDSLKQPFFLVGWLFDFPLANGDITIAWCRLVIRAF